MDIVPSKDELNAARNGIYLQLKETTNLAYHFGSLTNAIEELGMTDFIENQVQVQASKNAWVRVTENRLRDSECKTEEIREVCKAVQKVFGETPAACDGMMMVSSKHYDELAEAVNKLSGAV